MYRVDIEKKQLTPMKPTTLNEHRLQERYDLQEWIEKTPEILGQDLLLIAKELPLSSGARLDLLAVDRNGALVVMELKRGDSGKNVEWQAIRYASYCASLLEEDILSIYADYLGSDERDAEERLSEFVADDITSVNSAQRIILCAHSFHSDAVSAVLWMRDFGVDITCIRIMPYVDEQGVIYVNPETIIPLPEAKDYIERRQQQARERHPQGPWSGFYYVNIGENRNRTWNDCRKFAYVSAGQGQWARNSIMRLQPGDQFFAYINGHGYVGHGEVKAPAVPIRDFTVEALGKSLFDLKTQATMPDENKDDDLLCEYCVAVQWHKTFPVEQARKFKGAFHNRNIICKLRDRMTLDYLYNEFDIDSHEDPK